VSELKPFRPEFYPTVYISGPMTGYEFFNFPEFNRAAAALRKKGFKVLNPPEFQPVEDGKTYNDYMRLDIRELTYADAVVVLEGWSCSSGAKKEVWIAQECLGIPVWREWDFAPMNLKMNQDEPKLDLPAIQKDKPGLPPEQEAALQAFLAKMRAELEENQGKGDWRYAGVDWLLDHLQEEVLELRVAVNGMDNNVTPEDHYKSVAEVVSEAADVANMAMMVADRVGNLRGATTKWWDVPLLADWKVRREPKAAVKHCPEVDGSTTYEFQQSVTPPPAVEAPAKPPKENVLEEAARLVGGERRGQYGHPLDAQTRIGEFMTVILKDKLKDGAKVDWKDVNLSMIGLKMARAMNSLKRDTIVDIAGYARVMELCEDEENRRAAA
jgi:NTP pyrophosphatase (non-canonical NTP hydrolase)